MFSSLTRETYMRDAEPLSMPPVLSPDIASARSTILGIWIAGEDSASLPAKIGTAAASAAVRVGAVSASLRPQEIAENNYLILRVDVS